jgi:hypothetical protein
MFAKTLKTVVLKTVTVTGVKLGTPADRIGQGLVAPDAAYPTDNLSRGQIPLPPNPEPEAARERQLSAVRMREQMHRRAGDAVPPASSAGCLSAPGFTAGRFVWSFGASPATGWRPATRTAAAGGARAASLPADPSRASFPGDLRHDDRLGRDCQSPDRSGGKWVARWEVCPAAAAGK